MHCDTPVLDVLFHSEPSLMRVCCRHSAAIETRIPWCLLSRYRTGRPARAHLRKRRRLPGLYRSPRQGSEAAKLATVRLLSDGNHYHLLLETPEPNLVKGTTK